MADLPLVTKVFGLIYLLLFRDLPGLLSLITYVFILTWYKIFGLMLPRLFDRATLRHPHKVAIHYHNKAYTFLELYNLSNKVSHWFEISGILNPVDVNNNANNGSLPTSSTPEPENDPTKKQVGLMLGNIPEMVSFQIGITRVKASFVLFNTNHRKETLLNAFEATNCKVFIFEAKYLKQLQEVADQLPAIRYFMFNRNTIETPTVLEKTELGKVSNYPGMSPKQLKEASETEDDFSVHLDQYPSSAITTKYSYTIKDKIGYLFTSGTTGGKIKSVPFDNHRYFSASLAMTKAFRLRNNEHFYVCLPFYHGFGGIMGLSQCIISGCTLTVADRFSASRFWKECRENKCTVALYISEICRYLLAQPESQDDTQHHIHTMIGLGLKKEIWAEFKRRFQIKKIYEFYGSTEGNAAFFNTMGVIGSCGFLPYYVGPLLRLLYPMCLIKVNPDTMEPYRGKDGLCVLAKVGEVGMLIGLIRKSLNYTKFAGYTSKKETSKKMIHNILKEGDSGFVSGDLVRMDFFGNLFFSDRTGDTFRWKGENVSTTEVEDIAAKLLNYRKCSVYGVIVPHADGRAGMISIECKPEEEIDLDDLYQQLKLQVPDYAIPKFVRLTDKIETTATHKIMKYKLQKAAFDPKNMDPKDRLFYFDRKVLKYLKLDDEIFQLIHARRIQF